MRQWKKAGENREFGTRNGRTCLQNSGCTKSRLRLPLRPKQTVVRISCSLLCRKIPSGKNIQPGGDRQARQKLGDESSRPFHQFIYHISKERERVQNDCDSPDSASSVSALTNINTKSYENVKGIWVSRGIWNDQGGILPGMVWKHESPLQITDNDRDLSPSPSPTVPSEHVTLNLQPRHPPFDWPFPAQANGPVQADNRASNGG